MLHAAGLLTQVLLCVFVCACLPACLPRRAFYQSFSVTPVGAQGSFTFQTSMPNCAPVSSYNVPVFIMPSAPPPAPPLPPKQMLDVNVQVRTLCRCETCVHFPGICTHL
jgi:hypothetical protein